MHHLQIPLTGTTLTGNYLWTIAMSLAWKELVENQLGGSAEVKTEDVAIRQLVDRLNSAVFNRGLLDASSYFIRSGMGQEEVLKARTDLLQEWNVSQSLLNGLTIQASEIFSYARLEKQLKWQAAFLPCTGKSLGREVNAFCPDNPAAGGARLASI